MRSRPRRLPGAGRRPRDRRSTTGPAAAPAARRTCRSRSARGAARVIGRRREAAGPRDPGETDERRLRLQVGHADGCRRAGDDAPTPRSPAPGRRWSGAGRPAASAAMSRRTSRVHSAVSARDVVASTPPNRKCWSRYSTRRLLTGGNAMLERRRRALRREAHAAVERLRHDRVAKARDGTRSDAVGGRRMQRQAPRPHTAGRERGHLVEIRGRLRLGERRPPRRATAGATRGIPRRTDASWRPRAVVNSGCRSKRSASSAYRLDSASRSDVWTASSRGLKRTLTSPSPTGR